MLASTIRRSERDSLRHGPRRAHLPIVTASRTVSGSTSATLLRWTTKAGRPPVRYVTSPAATGITPAITPSSVDLPEPFGPTSAVVADAGIRALSRRSTGRPA